MYHFWNEFWSYYHRILKTATFLIYNINNKSIELLRTHTLILRVHIYTKFMKYKLNIIRKAVKHLRIKVVDENTVLATAPEHMSQDKILAFVKSKQSWIQKHLVNFKDASKLLVLPEWTILLHWDAYSPMLRKWQWTKYTIDHNRKYIRRGHDLHNVTQQTHRYKVYAKSFLPLRLEQLSKKHWITYSKCFVRDQKTKWWSCSSKWNIWLNWRLIKLPFRVMDYVICHELAHRKHMNHSESFWNYCESICKDTGKAKVWLKKYWRNLK